MARSGSLRIEFWICFSVVSIALFATGAVPKFTRTCGGGNETAACASLRILAASQMQLRDLGAIDLDGDGRGEYGTFSELSGATGIRGGRDPLSPPLISGAYRNPDSAGRVSRTGYHFQIWLPGAGGRGATESEPEHYVPTNFVVTDLDGNVLEGFRAASGEAPPVHLSHRVNPDLAELAFLIYAWPVEYGNSGDRTFLITPDHIIYTTTDPDYSGKSGPRPGAGLVDGGLLRILGRPADMVEGQDGNVWTLSPY